MTVLKLTGFAGEAPRVAPRLLPDNAAQLARSVRLEDGTLAPFRNLSSVATLTPSPPAVVKTLYRHLTDWLYWTTTVHAVPGPVATDRLYYTGDGVPKMRVGSTIYDLKVPSPTAALTGTPAGVGAGTVYTRLYVYTFVTAYGEESAPNPISNEVSWQAGQTVTLSGFQSAPGGRNITLQRIYRSQTGTSGGTVLYLIAERAASNTNYVDSIAADAVGEPLPSLDFDPPPDDLHNLVGLPNGMMAAISGKDLCFSEPWQPHAWPIKYRLTLDYPGTGLGCYGTTLVVGTTGTPYLCGGSAPDVMVLEKLELNLPCLNSAGMVDLGYTVVYPSHDGLVQVTGGGASVPTAALFTRDQWLQLDPANLVCGQFYGRFFASYSYTDRDGMLQEGTLLLDLTGSQPFVIRSQHKADAFFYDITSGALFLAIGDTVYEFDAQDAIDDTYTWRSKAYIFPAPTNFGALLFEIDDRDDPDALAAYAAAVAEVAAFNTALFATGDIGGALNGSILDGLVLGGDLLHTLPAGPQIAVNVYADSTLIATLTTPETMQRLPSTRRARQWEVEVTGNIRMTELTMAGTGQELRSI